jgi:hypothetical protein
LFFFLTTDYSSICCFVGTNRGNVATFKILPASNGTYSAAFAGFSAVEDKVISIIPIDADSGGQAFATPNAVGGLRTGAKINGVVIAVTSSSCRIFKPPTSKGAHKTWDDYLCDSAAVVKVEGRGYSLVGLFGDGNARAFSIPALKEIGCARIDYIADLRRLSEASITPTGNVMTWVGPSEVGLFNVWGSSHKLYVVHFYFQDRATLMTLTGAPRKIVSTILKKWSLPVLPLLTSSGSLALNMSHQRIWTCLVREPFLITIHITLSESPSLTTNISRRP